MDVKLLSVEVPTSSCICLPFPKKNLRTRIFSVASEKFGCSVVIDSVVLHFFRTRISVVASAKVWMFSCYQWKCPRPVVSAFRCRKKFFASGYFRSQAKSMDVQLLSIQLSCRTPAKKYGCLVVIDS